MEEEDRPEPATPPSAVTRILNETALSGTRFASYDVEAETDKLTRDERLRSVRSSFMVRGYEVLEEIGRGGMGVVYKARDTRLKRLVALKMILAGDHADQRALGRFRAEAEVLARVEHAGIVQVYEVGELNGNPFLILEFIDGGSLTDFTQRKPVDAIFAARTVEAVARAIQAAHDQGIAHRDLKPDNILMLRRPAKCDDTHSDRSGMLSASSPIMNAISQAGAEASMEEVTPKVADFGLAKQVNAADGLTRTGAILGSPNYMAPEQASGDIHEVGFAADIYALGAILYYLLTGRPPFLGTSAAETILMVRDADPVAPTQLQPKLSKDIETICLKCLEKDPNKRFASARELKDELTRFIHGEPILSRPLSPTARAWRWCRRNVVLAMSLSAVALSLAALFVTAITAAIWMARLADKEKEARRNAENHLIQLHTTNALRLTDQGNLSGSLPWFAEAIRLVEQRALEDGSPNDSLIPRLRLAATLRQCPKYSQLWFEENFIHQGDFSPDGRLVVLSGQSGLARVLDVETGELAGPALKHPDHVLFSVLGPNGRDLATCCKDNFLRIWDWSTGEIQSEPMCHTGPVRHASFDLVGKRIVSASEDGSARIWEVESGRMLFELQHDDAVLRASFDPEGRTILTASSDGTARLWDAETGVEIARLSHAREVRDAVWSPDGRYVATASRDQTGRVWNLHGDPVTPPLKHHAVLTGVAFSHDGRRLVTASEDKTARVWDATTGEPLTLPLKHKDYVSQATFSPDDRFVLTGSEDTTAVVWNSQTGDQIGQVLQHNDRVMGATFAPNGRQILTRVNRSAIVWDLSSIEQGAKQFRHDQQIWSGVLSPDGMRVATGGADGVARIWSVEDAIPLTKPLEHRFPIIQVCFVHGGKWLVTAGAGNAPAPQPRGELRVWDASNGEEIHVEWFESPVELLRVSASGKYMAVATGNKAVVLETVGWTRLFEAQHQDHVFGIDFHPDESRFVTGSYDKSVQIWEISTGSPLGDPLPNSGRVDHVEFSADGQWLLITCSGEGGVSYSRIYDASTNEIVATHLEPDSFYFLSASFSPSLDKVVNCLSDAAILSDAFNGATIAAPMRHKGMVQEACFSPDGRLVATASWDSTARVWDVKTGQPVSPPLQHNDWVTHVEFSPDGTRLLTVSRDRAALIWDVRGTDEETQQLRLVSELLSHQRASADGVTVDLRLTDVRDRWRGFRETGSPLMRSSESQILAWYRRQLKDALGERDWNGALFHSKQIVQIQPEDSNAWIDRGVAHAEMAHWSSAADSFARADSENVSIDFLCDYALVSLACHNVETYTNLCKRLTDRLNRSLMDPSLSRILLTCSLDPDSQIIWDDLIELAKMNSAVNFANQRSNLAIAIAMYRAGRYAELFDVLGYVDEPKEQATTPLPIADNVLRDILIAMAKHRTGGKNLSEQLDQIQRDLDNPDAFAHWDERLRASLLLAEAERTIRGDQP